MDKFLENQYILYILCFLGITNLLGFLYVKDYDSMVLLVALGIVTSYFSENHSIQISVALIGTNFIFVNKKVSEGFKAQRKKIIKEKFKVNPKGKSKTKEKFTGGEDSQDTSEEQSCKKNGNGECEHFSNKKKIDRSATLKDAYSNISTVLGKGGLSNLTKETEELVSQQKDLIKQMASLGPIIANVSSLAKNIPAMSGLLKGDSK